MKTKLHLALLIVLVVLLNACKKNGTVEAPAKKLKYLTQVIATNGTTTTFTDYTYDDQKRLTTIKTGGGTTITYTYNGDNVFLLKNHIRME
ncbi:MAG: hypothetical protein JWQ34_3304 [Mucilaginibacter sp.]|uniref:hypothetical protein n=1 Tax=Mucilaginibacter sp. TaxID=1882438 RepID=UPI00263075C4|nr:hypothetical protein [Mucilaginibacter sp.]MDB5005079.1 hypothetical protein [Mucilaginibacter sp.]